MRNYDDHTQNQSDPHSTIVPRSCVLATALRHSSLQSLSFQKYNFLEVNAWWSSPCIVPEILFLWSGRARRCAMDDGAYFHHVIMYQITGIIFLVAGHLPMDVRVQIRILYPAFQDQFTINVHKDSNTRFTSPWLQLVQHSIISLWGSVRIWDILLSSVLNQDRIGVLKLAFRFTSY